MPPKRSAAAPKNANCTSKKSKPTPTVEYHEDYQDPKADVVLVSSDEVYFKVHSYILKTASVVFEDMLVIGDGNNEEIALTDPDFEDSQTVHSFLLVFQGKAIPELTKANDNLYLNLIHFATKYRIVSVMRQIVALTLKALMDGTVSPFTASRLAFTVGSPQLAAAAIANCGAWHHSLLQPKADQSDEDRAKERDRCFTAGNVIGSSCLDPNSMSENKLNSIPEPYRWALMRATYGQIQELHLASTNWGQISRNFLQVIKLSQSYKE
ncbi:uncharacterized protein I303_107817 [Kwoniella dejecticola CBS 10117]|uniref:BTB domain-containing protein n=1 Tax=Kwoniella dejecticola CBS 10117 TaxID=1296121 RepID=A0A1A5ZVS7_9TREE|nr:uncharacterized protein I303_07820 [Kwoniella dejecticola CBS 10117]OBR81910.1 hypothetical protein I303_07820 [Kwoniella dejecticola CBS 10117]